MEITRQNLVESLNKINAQIDECKSKTFKYITGERYLTGWAIICNVPTVKELAEILTYLLNQKSNTSEAEKLLGIESDTESPTICGYTVDEWKDDVMTRKLELDNIHKIQDLKKAKEILEAHLSEDDKFALDMQKVAEFLK
jgi:hypothetical protein